MSMLRSEELSERAFLANLSQPKNPRTAQDDKHARDISGFLKSGHLPDQPSSQISQQKLSAIGSGTSTFAVLMSNWPSGIADGRPPSKRQPKPCVKSFARTLIPFLWLIQGRPPIQLLGRSIS